MGEKKDDQAKTTVLKDLATDIQKKKMDKKGAKAIEEEKELIAKQIDEIKNSDDTIDNKIDEIINLDYRTFGENTIIDAIIELYNKEYNAKVVPSNISWYVNRIGIGNDFIEYAKSDDQKEFFRKEKQEYINGLKKQLDKCKDNKKEEEPFIPSEETPDTQDALDDFIQEMETNGSDEDLPTSEEESTIAATINSLRGKAEALLEEANKTKDAIAQLEKAEAELNRLNKEEASKIEEIKKEYAEQKENIMLEIKHIQEDLSQ